MPERSSPIHQHIYKPAQHLVEVSKPKLLNGFHLPGRQRWLEADVSRFQAAQWHCYNDGCRLKDIA